MTIDQATNITHEFIRAILDNPVAHNTDLFEYSSTALAKLPAEHQHAIATYLVTVKCADVVQVYSHITQGRN